jgi:hypothetical protein
MKIRISAPPPYAYFFFEDVASVTSFAEPSESLEEFGATSLATGALPPRKRRERFGVVEATGTRPLGTREPPVGPFVREEGVGFFDTGPFSEFFPDLATAARLPANGPRVKRCPAIA